MKFIILTRASDGKAMYVNPNQICFMDSDANNEHGTLIQFCGYDDNYILVLESPETIAELCKGMTE